MPVFERLTTSLKQIAFLFEVRRSRLLQVFVEALQTPFGHTKVGED